MMSNLISKDELEGKFITLNRTIENKFTHELLKFQYQAEEERDSIISKFKEGVKGHINYKDFNLLQDKVMLLDNKVNTDLICMLEAKEKHTDIKLKGKADKVDLEKLSLKANQVDLEILSKEIRGLERQINYLDAGSDSDDDNNKKLDEMVKKANKNLYGYAEPFEDQMENER